MNFIFFSSFAFKVIRLLCMEYELSEMFFVDLMEMNGAQWKRWKTKFLRKWANFLCMINKIIDLNEDERNNRWTKKLIIITVYFKMPNEIDLSQNVQYFNQTYFSESNAIRVLKAANFSCISTTRPQWAKYLNNEINEVILWGEKAE